MAQRKSEKPKKIKISPKQEEFYKRIHMPVNSRKKGK